MYLRALEIQGFKSFPDKTVLTFGSDITAIVGPNGSGKSNISDAIRWVMGEMSTKALRGSKMEDVIFGGTLRRSQVGFAEVSLVLDNTARNLNVENDEVMVTRRYYRSGDSEYYINRQTARLKDINEMFMDTGLGKEGYSNIGQGRIDEILSAKSTDRREIFEEAAGISKYRHRKEETERKLEATHENLLRINDKISELQLQVDPLREQSEKAKKYLVYRDELRGLEVTVWLRSLDKLAVDAGKLTESYTSAKFVLDQGHEELDELYRTAEALAVRLREMDAAAERLREQLTQLEHQQAEKNSQAAVLETKLAGNEANIARARAEIEARETRSGDLDGQIAEQAQRIEAIDGDLQSLADRLAAESDDVQTQRAACAAAETALGELSQRRTALLEKSAAIRSAITAGSASVEHLRARAQEVAQTVQEATDRRTELDREAEACQAALQTARDTVQQQKNIIDGHALKADSRKQQLEQLQKTVDERHIEQQTVRSKAQMLREMERDYEGFSKAIRIVMQEREKGRLQGIRGPVSKLLTTDDQYTVAIETALGAAMQNVVVETEEAGKAAISLLRRRDGGRATFLPMNVIRGRTLNEQGLEQAEGFVGLASQLIRCDGAYESIMENLLGRTAIAEDMDKAIAIARRFGHRFRIVTLDGQVLNAGGSMTGGSATRSAGILTRTNELRRLEAREKALAEELSQLDGALQEAARASAAAEAEIAAAESKLREAEDQVLRQEQQEGHFAILRRTVDEALETSRQEQEALTLRLSGGQDENESLQKEEERLTAQAAAMEGEIGEKTQTREAQELALQAAQEQVTGLRLQMSALEAERQTAAAGVEQLKALAEALQGDRSAQEALVGRYETENEALRQSMADRRREAGDLAASGDAIRQQLTDAAARRREVEAKKTATERESQNKNKDILQMERELSRLEQRKQAAEMEERQIIDKLWDTYELTNTTAQSARVEIESAAAAQKRIGELKRKMGALGTPNLGAIEEFERVNERYEYLTGQRDDVETAGRELLKIVGGITEEMTEIFKTEFSKINEYFGKTFVEMFGGGKGSLELEDADNVLTCGIEIKVQPPGKQLKTLTLLSGGEKAFVAIALYFAIMKVRPTPFCMLDEIDAALDDRNVRRFASYLRNLSAETQFIVITHRRGTMEEADVLYGVTMQEQGISKVLSVDLNSVAKELRIS